MEAAKLMIHETWAYEVDSTHGAFPEYGCDQKKMYALLKAAYTDAAKAVDAGIIPVGDTVQRFRETVPGFGYPDGGESLCRDGFHLAIPAGRYLAALVWLETLCGIDARDVTFLPEGLTEEKRVLIAEAVHRILPEERDG